MFDIKTCTIYLSMYMLSCDSLFILSHRFQFVKTFFKSFLKKFLTSSQPRTLLFPYSLALSTDDLIIIHSITPFVNTFFSKNLNLTIKNVRISQKNAESAGIFIDCIFPRTETILWKWNLSQSATALATFSLVLAIAALASTLTMTIVIPIFLAILSIMFGLLSRGNTSMSNHALAGVIVACSALLINIAVGGFSFFIVFSNSDAKQQYWTMVNDTYEQMTVWPLTRFWTNTGSNFPKAYMTER